MKTLAIAARVERLAEAVAFARESCGVAAEPLELVVEELFLNIAFHACPGEIVEIACAAPATVEFRYPGPCFDPRSDAPVPDLDASLADRPIGGLGVHLVRELAESIDYRHEGGRNTLIVRVRR